MRAGTLLTQLLGRLGLHGNTDLEEIGRAYATLAAGEARSAFVHALRAVVDHKGQRVSALQRIAVDKRLRSLIIWGIATESFPCVTAATSTS